MIQSVAGALAEGRISRQRPYRAPHHSASMAALTGGGLKARPGEISLAHKGILFLDELAEFSRAVLDSLRQPLETGMVTVARANAHLDYPADVQLVAAMNPCRCGHLGDAALACHKAPRCAQDYQSRISGPLMDRMDIHIDVPAVSARDLTLPPPAEDSRVVAARVAAARARQQRRFEKLGESRVTTNARADGRILEEIARPDDAGATLLEEAAERFRLTARGYHRVLRVARTLADLAGAERVTRSHIAEALAYRRMAVGGL
jgi:magnesium chelatase family protein